VSSNLDLVRSIYADWERGDFSKAEWAHPEMEYTIVDGPQPGTWIGHMPKGFRDWTSAWEGYRTEAEEYRELDAGRVLVLTRASGRGKRSGIELSQLQGMVFYVRDGKVTKLVIYSDGDRALADLGLEEYAMPEESTTRDLEEALRRSMGAVNRRDFDAAMILYAPNAVWDASPMGLDVFQGREAIRGFFDDWWGSYEDFEQELEEFRGLGNGVSLVVSRQRARLPGSSVFVELRYAAVVTWIDGLVERVTVYADIDEARAAAKRLALERG
jgi:ketosteroid isomerase-like protein